jgi:hypothetical protein
MAMEDMDIPHVLTLYHRMECIMVVVFMIMDIMEVLDMVDLEGMADTMEDFIIDKYFRNEKNIKILNIFCNFERKY